MCKKMNRSGSILLSIIIGPFLFCSNISYASDRLVNAIKAGDTVTIKELINSGEDVNLANSYGTTPLIQAIDSNNVEIIKFLLDKGADPNILGKKEKDIFEYSPLGLAFEIKDNKDIVRLLLNKPINCDFRNKYTDSYLHTALIRENFGNFDIEHTINMLIKNGCRVNERNKYGSTPIFFARSYKAFQLLMKHGADLSVINSQGQNLFFAVASPEMGRHLTKTAKLDINQKDNKGNTPIFFAKNGEYIRFLVKNNADPYHINAEGNAPLFSIFDKGGDYLSLIRSGVDVNRNYGENQITFAHHIMKIINDKIEIYNLSTGPVYSVGNKNKDAFALMVRASNQNMSRVDILKGVAAIAKLMSLNANFSVKDSNGKAPVDYICHASPRKYIEELIESYPLEAPTVDYGAVITMLITNLVPGDLNLDEMKNETSDEFLKEKIEECKKLPKGKYTWDDISKMWKNMLE